MKSLNNTISFTLNNTISYFFYIILILEYIFVFGIGVSHIKILSHILEIQLFIVYLISLFFTWRNYGFRSIFGIFLLCLGLFNFQRFFLGYFVGVDYRNPDLLLYLPLKEITVQKTLFIYTLFTYVVTRFYYIFNRNTKQVKTFNYVMPSDQKLIKVGKYILILFFPLVVYRGILEFILLAGGSFTDIYSENIFLNIPTYLKISSILFQLGFMMLLGGKPPIKTFYLFGIIYLFTFIPNLIIGLRAIFAVTSLFLVWYYLNIYNKKINVFKASLLLISAILLLQYIALFRSNLEIEGGLFKNIISFLISQSQSMYVLSYYVQYKEIINNLSTYPFVLDPLISWIFPNGQSIEVINVRSSLGHQLIYVVNSNYYLSGGSLGTSFIAEVYQFGLLGVFCGAVFFAYLISLFNKNYSKSRVLLIFSMFFVQYFLMAPRSNFLPNFYFLIRYIVIFIFIYLIFISKNKLFSTKT